VENKNYGNEDSAINEVEDIEYDAQELFDSDLINDTIGSLDISV